MKLKNLIFICIGAVLLIACVGLIYNSLYNESDIGENNSKANNISSVNNSDINGTENNTTTTTNEIASVGNVETLDSLEKKNQPKNVPKNSKLSYSEVSKIANSYKPADGGSNDGFYTKYNGYTYEDKDLYWKFNIFSKDNRFLGEIRVSDATGYIDLG